MFGALSGVFAHAAALVVCFWGVLLLYFAFRVLGLPAVERAMAMTVVHRCFLRCRLPALHGLELAKHPGDTAIGHIVRTPAGLLVVDVRDYERGALAGDPESATWTHIRGLHRTVVPNPLPENRRHRHLVANASGLRDDAIDGRVVVAGNCMLPPEIEALVLRPAALEAALRACEGQPYLRQAELARGWNLLCDVAELGPPTTLLAVRDFLHPRHMAEFEPLQWAATCAGLVGLFAFWWGLSIMRR